MEKTPTVIDVKIGNFEIAKGNIKLKTILGSCVAVIMYDKKNKIGGLAHVFLPERGTRTNEEASKFADTAIPLLKEELIKQGARKSFIVAYLVGGNQMFAAETKNKKDFLNIGARNIEACKIALEKEHILPMMLEVGKLGGSKVIFDLNNGDIKIEELNKIEGK